VRVQYMRADEHKWENYGQPYLHQMRGGIDAAGNVVGTRTTSVDGSYAFTDLSSEQYTVIASGYPPVAAALRVSAGQEAVHDVQLGYSE